MSRPHGNVSLDPLALTIADDEHTESEIRWITVGKDATDRYVLVVHTFEPLAANRTRVRFISARTADEDGSSGLRGTKMKAEYDFSKGERGKFFRPGAELRLPIYLRADVQSWLAERAAEKAFRRGNGEFTPRTGNPHHRLNPLKSHFTAESSADYL